jgi:tRNA threonylcarbamoyl adenosine modification protein (Sua5/YciO/YrdC/YwlC family)
VLLQIDAAEPEGWLVARAADILRRGGVAVIATDTVYGLACTISSAKSIQRIYALKDLDPKKPLAILVGDLATVSRYARGISTSTYRMMKRVLPGPYTFIFEATRETPKIMLRRRRTIGIRMPANPIVLELMAELDEPLITTSVRTADEEFINDPVTLEAELGDKVDLVIDGGALAPEPSTVVDFSSGEPVLLREGKGDLETLSLF